MSRSRTMMLVWLRLTGVMLEYEGDGLLQREKTGCSRRPDDHFEPNGPSDLATEQMFLRIDGGEGG